MQLTDKERELVIAVCRNDLSIHRAARDLHYHCNTLRYQAIRLAEKTGYDCRTFNGALHLMLNILWEDR